MLVACSKERGEEALNNYQSRLENVFEPLEFELVSSSQVDDVSVPSLPNKVIREARFDNQASTINLLDFCACTDVDYKRLLRFPTHLSVNLPQIPKN